MRSLGRSHSSLCGTHIHVGRESAARPLRSCYCKDGQRYCGAAISRRNTIQSAMRYRHKTKSSRKRSLQESIVGTNLDLITPSWSGSLSGNNPKTIGGTKHGSLGKSTITSPPDVLLWVLPALLWHVKLSDKHLCHAYTSGEVVYLN